MNSWDSPANLNHERHEKHQEMNGSFHPGPEPFDRAEWIEAARIAPSFKSDFYTVLSLRDCLPEIESALNSDPKLQQCFR
jgi:hypothetical protein